MSQAIQNQANPTFLQQLLTRSRTIRKVSIVLLSLTLLITSSCTTCIYNTSCMGGFRFDILPNEDNFIRPGTYTITLTLNREDIVEAVCIVDTSTLEDTDCQIIQSNDTSWVLESSVHTCNGEVETCKNDQLRQDQNSSAYKFSVSIYKIAGSQNDNPNYTGPQYIEAELHMDGQSEHLGLGEYKPNYNRKYNDGKKGCGWCESAIGNPLLLDYNISPPEQF